MNARDDGLAQFKAIFFVGIWSTALLGRVIGFAFAVPSGVVRVATRRVPRGYGWRLVGVARARRAAGSARLADGAIGAGRVTGSRWRRCGSPRIC